MRFGQARTFLMPHTCAKPHPHLNSRSLFSLDDQEFFVKTHQLFTSSRLTEFEFIALIVTDCYGCCCAASRPKRLLVFINPFGGKGQGKHIYEKKVAPLFTLASITTEIISKCIGHGVGGVCVCRGHLERDSHATTGGDFSLDDHFKTQLKFYSQLEECKRNNVLNVLCL